MKKLISVVTIAVVVGLLSGCVGLSLGGGAKTVNQNATVGQQLIDLQKAKDTGAISPAEYETQKAKLLGKN